jgi:histidyl-tRNA synthetase
MSGRIEPRTLKGFPDTMPAAALARDRVVRAATGAFERFGYVPIDTPALEYAEILRGKGGTESDKQMFEFDDAGGRRVALRFDLTVPLARFVAEHQGELVFPFRRYHVGTAWRGERPQKGRVREFVQCDADLVGATGPAADAEAIQVFLAAFDAAGLPDAVVRVNDRRALNAVLGRFGLAERATAVLRAIDKWDKVGPEAVGREVVAGGASEEQASRVLGLGGVAGASNDETIARLEAEAGPGAATEGFEGLRETLSLLRAAGVEDRRLRVDPLLARGLDYYTGIVVEAYLPDLPSLGSVGSGGRYDDLAGLYTSTRLPGVGISLGVYRIVAALEERGLLPPPATATAMVAHPESGGAHRALALAARLRAEGLPVEVFPEPRKHGAQMRYADKRGVRFVLTVDPDGSVQGKDLKTGEAFHAAAADAGRALRARLDGISAPPSDGATPSR